MEDIYLSIYECCRLHVVTCDAAVRVLALLQPGRHLSVGLGAGPLGPLRRPGCMGPLRGPGRGPRVEARGALVMGVQWLRLRRREERRKERRRGGRRGGEEKRRGEDRRKERRRGEERG